MTLVSFELKKLIKSRLMFIFLGIGLLFPVSLFISNHFQLTNTQKIVKQEYETILSMALAKRDTLKELKEGDKGIKDDLLKQATQNNLTIVQLADDVITKIEKRDENLNLTVILLYKQLKKYNRSNYQELAGEYFISDKKIEQTITYFSELARTSSTYESSRVTTNLPNFIYIMGTFLFGIGGVCLLIIMLNIPLIMELMEGNVLFSLFEYKQYKGKSVHLYLLYQLIVLSGLMVVLLAFGIGLSLFFGKGLLTDTQNTWNYPLQISGSHHIFAIWEVFWQWGVVIFPLIGLLNVLIKPFLFKAKQPIIGCLLFIGLLILIVTLSKLKVFHHIYNPFVYLAEPQQVSTILPFIIGSCIVGIQLLVSSLLNKAFKHITVN